MRILVLSHEYPPIGGGGSRVVQDLTRGFARLGHEVQIITAQWKDLPHEETQDGVKIHRLASGRTQPFGASLSAMARFVLAGGWATLRLTRVWKPDVIHVHFAVPNGAAALVVARLTGVPYVLTVHLGDVPGGSPEKTGGWFRWIAPFTPPIWKGAAQVVAVSQFTRSLALPRYPVDIQVIFNGVDLDELDPGEIRLNQPARVIFAGRFVAQKDLLQLVRSLAAVKDLPWTCSLLGDGDLRGEVEQEIARQGLQERFSLLGWVTPQKVIEGFRHSDILFMPSRSEGLPVVGVQATAMGLALVLSQVGGNVDLVEAGTNGFLVDLAHPQGFEEALRALLSNPEKLLAFRQASRRVAKKFDLDGVVQSYDQIFSRVAHR
jgi:glycosyltransferase involved in cell wall biosynthesis